MSEDQLNRLREGYAVWNAGDVEALVAHTPATLEYHLRHALPDMPERFRGAEVRELFEVWFSGPWEGTLHGKIDHLIEVDPDHVLVLLTFSGAGAGSGIPVSLRYSHFWTFRDGEPVLCDGFPGWKRGLQAAGLERIPE